MKKNLSQWKRLSFAAEGLKNAWTQEASFRTEVVLGAGVVVGMRVVGFPLSSWLWVCLAAALVLICELINTSLEALCDAVHPGQHPLIKTAKDCASAAVLVSALLSVVIFSMVVWLRWH